MCLATQPQIVASNHVFNLDDFTVSKGAPKLLICNTCERRKGHLNWQEMWKLKNTDSDLMTGLRCFRFW